MSDISELGKVRPGYICIKVRPEVAAFAQLMELTLCANDHKGGWKGMSIGELLERLHQEQGEMMKEIMDPNFNTTFTVKEIIDCANFLMMIADHYTPLAKYTPPPA